MVDSNQTFQELLAYVHFSVIETFEEQDWNGKRIPPHFLTFNPSLYYIRRMPERRGPYLSYKFGRLERTDKASNSCLYYVDLEDIDFKSIMEESYLDQPYFDLNDLSFSEYNIKGNIQEKHSMHMFFSHSRICAVGDLSQTRNDIGISENSEKVLYWGEPLRLLLSMGYLSMTKHLKPNIGSSIPDASRINSDKLDLSISNMGKNEYDQLLSFNTYVRQVKNIEFEMSIDEQTSFGFKKARRELLISAYGLLSSVSPRVYLSIMSSHYNVGTSYIHSRELSGMYRAYKDIAEQWKFKRKTAINRNNLYILSIVGLALCLETKSRNSLVEDEQPLSVLTMTTFADRSLYCHCDRGTWLNFINLVTPESSDLDLL
jgi:hypothetical protein